MKSFYKSNFFSARFGKGENINASAVFLMIVVICLMGFSQSWGQTITVTLTSGTSWTVPNGVTSITVQCWGAGGGGGSQGTTKGSAGGGGGGGYATASGLSVTPGNSIPISIGTGAANTTGNPTTITVGTYTVTATGGGAGGTGTSTTTAGGSGGTGGSYTGSSGVTGNTGGTGYSYTAGGFVGGDGGGAAGTTPGGNATSSAVGSGGSGNPGTSGNGGPGGSSAAGIVGVIYGGGGGGSGQNATTSRAGGAGGAGVIVITFTPNTWVSTTTGGDWTVGSNWSAGTAPAGNDYLAFNPASGATLTIINIPTTALNSLNIAGAGGTVVLQGATSGNIITINSGVTNALNLSAGSLTIGTNLSISVASGSTNNVAASQTLTINSGSTLTLVGGITNAGTISVTGTLEVNGNPTITSTGTITYNSGATLLYSGTTTHVVGAEWGSNPYNVNVTNSSSSGLQINTTNRTIQNNLNVSAGLFQVKTGSPTITIGGNINFTGGTFYAQDGTGTATFNVGSSNTGTVFISNENFYMNFGSGTAIINGNLTLNSGTYTGEYDGGSGATINGSVTVNGGTYTSATTTSGMSNTIGGNLSVTGGIFYVTTPYSVSTTQQLVVTGSVSVSGTGVLDLNSSAAASGSSAQLYIAGNLTVSGGTLERTSTGTGQTNGIYFNGTGTQNFTWSGGNVYMYNGASATYDFWYKTSGGPTAINETYNSSSAAQTTIYGGAVDVPASGYAALSNIGNVTINNSNGVTLGAAMTVNGTLTLTSGVFTLSNALTMASGTTILRTGGSVSAAPTFAGTVNVTYGDGTYTSAITTGNELPPIYTTSAVLASLVSSGYAPSSFLSSTTNYGSPLLADSSLLTSQNSWTPAAADQTYGQWVGANMQSVRNVTAIGIESRYNVAQWVATFQVQYSLDSVTWNFVGGNSTPTTFNGNSSENALVINSLSFSAKYVRIWPVTDGGSYMSMRWEVYALSSTPSTSLNNLTVNVSGGVTLNAAANVNGTLALTNGIFSTTTTNIINIANTSTSAISGSPFTTSYIEGPMTWTLLPNISADGTSYFYPVADGSNNYRPIQLANVRTGATSPVVKVTVSPTGASTFNSPILVISQRNWYVQLVSGNFTSSTITLTENLLLSTNLMGESSPNQSGAYSSIGGNSIGTTITSNTQAVTSLPQYFAIGNSVVALISLSDDGTQLAAGNVSPGLTSVLLHQSAIAVTGADAYLNGMTCTTAGTYATADITNLKVWFSATNSTFNAGTATLLSTLTSPPAMGSQTFPAFSGSAYIQNGTTGYIYITADIASGATLGNTININALANGNFTFATGNITGNTISNGGVQTISAATISLSDNAPQIAAASVAGATGNVVLHQSALAVTVANATLTGMTCTTGGSYLTTDIVDLKVWYSASSTFNSGTATLLSTLTTPGTAGSKTFPSFTPQAIVNGATGYIYITADIAGGATIGNTINVNALGTSNFTYISAGQSGSTANGGVQTIAGSVYYNKASGAARLDLTANWGGNTDGSGAQPASFTANGQTFNVTNGGTANTIGAAWTVSGTNSNVAVGNGTTAATFTIPSSYIYSSPTTNISNNATLTNNNASMSSWGTMNVSGTYTHNCNGGTLPIATWNSPNSTCNITGFTGTFPANLNQGSNLSYQNFTWNNPPSEGTSFNMNNAMNNVVINGNLNVLSTNGNYLLYLMESGNTTLTVKGNLLIGTVIGGANNGAAYLLLGSGTGTGTLNLYGNVEILGASGLQSLTTSTHGVVNIYGNYVHTFDASEANGAFWNANYDPVDLYVNQGTLQVQSSMWSNIIYVENGASINFQGNQLVNGALSSIGGGPATGVTTGVYLYAGSTFATSNTAGIYATTTTGTLLGSTVLANSTFNADANYIFNAATTTPFPTTAQKASFGNPNNITFNAAATLNRTISFDGALTLNALLDISTFNLTGNSASTISSSSSNYVKTSSTGQLMLTVGSGAVTYPVGKSAYNPFIITNSGTSDIYGVRVLDVITTPAPVDPTLCVDHYWYVTEGTAGGSNLTVTAQWNNGETGANYASGSQVYIGYYVSSAWGQTMGTQSGSGPYTATINSSVTFTDLTGGGYFGVGKDAAFIAPQPPTITGVSPNPACEKSSLTITGTYLGNASVTINGVPVQSITSNSGTQIVVVVATGTAPGGTVTVTTPVSPPSSYSGLTVYSLPSITSATPGTACPSSTVTLSAAASAGTVNWWNAATNGTLETTGNTYTPPVSSTTTYYVDATANGCTTYSRTSVLATWTTETAPTALTVDSNNFCLGALDYITLTAAGTSGAPSYLKWYSGGCGTSNGGTLISAGTGLSSFQINPAPTATTTYYVRAEGTCTTTACQSLQENVNTGCPCLVANISSQPSAFTSVCVGNGTTSTTVTIDNTGTRLFNYQWYSSPDGTNWTALTNTAPYSGAVTSGTSARTSTLTITNPGSAYNNMQYRCVITNCTNLTATSSSVTLTLTTSATITSTTNGSTCGAGTVSLSATATPSNAIIEWFASSSGGSPITEGLASGSTYSPSITATTTYYVLPVTGNGCDLTTRTAVTGTVLPVVNYGTGSTSGNPVPSSCSSSPATISTTGSTTTITGQSTALYQTYLTTSCFVKAYAAQNTKYQMFGLATTPYNTATTANNYVCLNFAIYPYANGSIYIFENGAQVGTTYGTYSAGDGFMVLINSSNQVVYYWQPGGTGSFNIIYTSAVTPILPLQPMFCMYNSGGTFNKVTVGVSSGGSITEEPMSWANVTSNCSTAYNPSSITKNANDGVWGDGAGATGPLYICGGTYNFQNLILNGAVSVTGGTGPLQFQCTGTATINGTLDVSGGPGGYATTTTTPGAGGTGGGGFGMAGGGGGNSTGTSGTIGGSYASLGGGGSGGPACSTCGVSGNRAPAGGGGGSYGTAGAAGGNGYTGVTGGSAGSVYPGSGNYTFTSSYTQGSYTGDVLGGSGGGGGGGMYYASGYVSSAGGGGGGGGAVLIAASQISISTYGFVNAGGGTGGIGIEDGGYYAGGSGGGGSGGSVIFEVPSSPSSGNNVGSLSSPYTPPAGYVNISGGSGALTAPGQVNSGTQAGYGGNGGTGRFILQVFSAPVVPTSATASNTNFCQGDYSTITLSATGGSGTTLHWFAGDPNSGGTSVGTGTPLTITAPTATTTYYVRWENCQGVTSTVNVIVNVGAQPCSCVAATLNSGPSAFAIGCAGGGSVSSTIVVNGSPNFTYQWYSSPDGLTWAPLSNTSPYSGAVTTGSNSNSSTLTISQTTTNMNNLQFYCVVTNCSNHTYNSGIITLTVVALPTIVSTIDSYTCNAGIVNLGATPSAGSVNWYTVSTGGTAISGITPPGTTYSPTISATTTFYAEATNQGCVSTTRTAVVGTVLQGVYAGTGNISLNYSPFSTTGGSNVSVSGNDIEVTGAVTMTAGTYNFHNFKVDNSAVITVSGSSPLIIQCTGTSSIYGTINSIGHNGSNGNGGEELESDPGLGGTGGAGNGGGTAGGTGGYGEFEPTVASAGTSGTSYGSWFGAGLGGSPSPDYDLDEGGGGGGGGGSYGSNGTAGTTGSLSGTGGGYGTIYGDANLVTLYPSGTGTNLLGGSGGGGGGGAVANCTIAGLGGGGGGGGGGAIQVSATSIDLTSGFINVSGGNGGIGIAGGGSACEGNWGASGGGGGGSGGTVYLQYTNTCTSCTAGSNVVIIGGTGGAAVSTQYETGGAGGNGGAGRFLAQLFTQPVPPTSASVNNATPCLGALIILTATGGSGQLLRWYSGSCEGTYVGTGTPLTITPASSGAITYYAQWEGCTGASGCVSVGVTVGGSGPTGVSASSNTPVCAGSTISLSSSATGATSYSWSGPNSFTSTAQNPAGITNVSSANAGTYTVTATNSCGSNTSTTTVAVSNCNFNYTVKFFLQGYYTGANTMSPLLHLLGATSATAVDTVYIQLWSNYSTMAYSDTGILQTNGTVTVGFPSAASGNSYYVVVKHRNSIDTWSANTTVISAANSPYDFTGSAGQAHGNNLVSLGGGVYAIYSGDINRDGKIDSSDKGTLQSVLSSFKIGVYNVNDITGDGFVDEDDLRILQNNIPLGITVSHP